MCDECGCKGERIILDKPVLEANNAVAEQIRHFCNRKGILLVNLMGSPGCGKTSVIEGLVTFVDPSGLFVIQGDLESDVDKVRLEGCGVAAFQVNTHSGCHLNAQMINDAFMDSDLTGRDFIIVENVGNLVCPADVDLGQHINVVVSSTTEGSDKPKKYPPIFRGADAVVISKIDLTEAAGFDEKRYLDDLGGINPKLKIFKTSSKKQETFKPLADYLIHRRDHLQGKEHKH